MHTQHAGQFAPSVHGILVVVATLFYIQTLYYLVRTLFITLPGWLRRLKGSNPDPDALYWLENDIGHGACMWYMGYHLAPFLAIPPVVTDSVLLFGAIWFGTRPYLARPKSEEYRMWWDGAHSAMFFGMWLMFHPEIQGQPVLVLAQVVFWAWFTGFYAKETLKAKKYRFGYFAHFDMGLVMFVMTAAFIVGSIANPEQPALHSSSTSASASGAAIEVDDGTYQREVEEANTETVAVLVWGGCEACAADAKVFDELASSLCAPNLKFVKIHIDRAPKAAAKLGVAKCPTVKVVSRGVVSQEGLEGAADTQQILNFIAKHRSR